MAWVCCGLGARYAAQAARVQIPAFAGMTWVCAGMTMVCAGVHRYDRVCAGVHRYDEASCRMTAGGFPM